MLKAILFTLIFSSCAYVQKIKSKTSPQKVNKNLKTKLNYKFTDKAGKFFLQRESRLSQKNYVVKNIVYPYDGMKDKPLEKSITISDPGTFKGKLNVLRPNISQYTVWFDKKKYFSEIKVDPKNKKLKILLSSPQKNWNGPKEYDFPEGSGYFCFYSQIIDCAKVSNFLKESSKRGLGKMNFHIIWEGYPYFQAQYENLNQEVFSPATLEYEGKNPKGLRRYNLSFRGQTLFYLLDDSDKIVGQYWIAQGLSVEREP